MPYKDKLQEKEYRSKHKEQQKLRSRAWYLRNRELCIKRAKEYSLSHPEWDAKVKKDWIKQNPEKRIFSSTKSRALKTGIPFDLDLSDIQIPEFCPYLGLRLSGLGGGRRTDNTPSIDKIDPEKGYVKGNIRIISNLANTMKQNASLDLLLAFAVGVISLHGDGLED